MRGGEGGLGGEVEKTDVVALDQEKKTERRCFLWGLPGEEQTERGLAGEREKKMGMALARLGAL